MIEHAPLWDTENWSTVCWKVRFVIARINYQSNILKSIKIDKFF